LAELSLTSQALSSCGLCPRECRANRTAGNSGYCGANADLRVARAALHHWEEPPISGSRGSGTIFFCNCSLRCVYCQNIDISRNRAGATISVRRLAEIYTELEAAGAHNINLVTPTHYIPQIREALMFARANGFSLPIVYNTSGYEQPGIIRNLDGLVNIFLTDFRYDSPNLASRYSDAADYPKVAIQALREMLNIAGNYIVDNDGILQSGIIIRFLLLPGQLNDAMRAISTVFALCGNNVCYSLMNQFTPMPDCSKSYPELARPVSDREYDKFIDYAISLGITNSYMQEGATAKESFIPQFDLTGVHG
jgi:putative pyruvate formate lyase activating enzyme